MARVKRDWSVYVVIAQDNTKCAEAIQAGECCDDYEDNGVKYQLAATCLTKKEAVGYAAFFNAVLKGGSNEQNHNQ